MLHLQAVEGEPEARRIARERRLAAKHAAIEAARQQMHEREQAAEQEKSQKARPHHPVTFHPSVCLVGRGTHSSNLPGTRRIVRATGAILVPCIGIQSVEKSR